MGALTPLGKVATRRRRWVHRATLYTLGGLITSALVGAGIALAGELVLTDGAVSTAAWGVAITGVLFAARELLWPDLGVPQLRRQTRDVWAKRSSASIVPFLWGLHIGLTFATYIAFFGAWFLALVVGVVGEAWYGAAVFAFYWLGRCLSVWIAPALIESPRAVTSLLDATAESFRLFQLLHVLGLVASTGLLVAWVMGGAPSV